MIFRKVAKLLYCYIAKDKKNNLTIQQYNNCKPKGFTLIELLVVLSATAVLGTLGIAGFVNYNRTQVLQTSANEVVTMLNLAKSRSQSQIKPSGLCSGGSLNGYKVIISPPLRSYTMFLVCSVGPETKIDQQDKLLPTNLSFSTNTSFFFPVQTGGVQASGQIVISSLDGKTKTITINSLGGVSVQ